MLKIRRKIMRKIIVKRGRQSKKGGSVTRPTSHRLTFPQLFCQNHPKAESQICATHFLLFFFAELYLGGGSIENQQKLGVHRKLQRCVKFPNMMCLMSYGHNCELFLMLGLILSKLRGTIWQLNTTNELLFFLQEDPEQHRLVWSLNYD